MKHASCDWIEHFRSDRMQGWSLFWLAGPVKAAAQHLQLTAAFLALLKRKDAQAAVRDLNVEMLKNRRVRSAFMRATVCPIHMLLSVSGT